MSLELQQIIYLATFYFQNFSLYSVSGVMVLKDCFHLSSEQTRIYLNHFTGCNNYFRYPCLITNYLINKLVHLSFMIASYFSILLISSSGPWPFLRLEGSHCRHIQGFLSCLLWDYETPMSLCPMTSLWCTLWDTTFCLKRVSMCDPRRKNPDCPNKGD